MINNWQYTKPPNEKWVEVEYNAEIVKAKAIWGRDGTLPHWELANGILIEPHAFNRWRELNDNNNN